MQEHLTEEEKNEYRRVAYYYYKNGLTQDEIAKRMGTSRQRINRILSACIKTEIVRIEIDGIENCNLELESKIEKKYGLKEVHVIENENANELNNNLGIESADYLSRTIKNDDIIGLSRGHAVAFTVKNIPYLTNLKNIIVTQLMGSTKEEESQLGVDRMAYQLAEKLSAREELLYVPSIVGSAHLKRAFMEDPICKRTYSVMKDTKIAIVGIGMAKKQWKHMMNLYNEDDMEHREWAEKVVGEVCTHFYDINGNVIEPPFRDRMLTIELKDYRKIPTRLGIAGGIEKFEAIKGAILGKYINVLVTDKNVAERLLE